MTRLLTLIAALLLAGPASAEQLANRLFGAVDGPSAQPPNPIGSYARGCAAGWCNCPRRDRAGRRMRLSRNRNWGQPEMIQFLQQLSVAAQQVGWAGLYIGDISQPRGGPMTSGHASHQIGWTPTSGCCRRAVST